MTLSHHRLLCFSPPPSPLRPQKLFSPSPHSPPPRLSLLSNPNLILSSSSSTPSPLRTLRPRPTTRSRVSIRGAEKRGERTRRKGMGLCEGLRNRARKGGGGVREDAEAGGVRHVRLRRRPRLLLEQLPRHRELLWLFLLVAHSDLFNEMGSGGW
uniref:Uncharacterized protein n=1 Tax=Ananas comosus var. bracteatus TaxID=296719 RepID=A0A6V7Q8X7_ANACO|nr:unnamed protein product [Ananas comosus var. bracteatus]